MPVEMSYPFRVSEGRVVTTDDPDAQVRNHVLALLNTHPEERVMVPGYGTDTQALVFEDDPEDSDVRALVGAVVTAAFSAWEPGVKITDTTAETDIDGSVRQVNIEYSRQDAADSGAVANANTAVIGPGGLVREIVRG